MANFSKPAMMALATFILGVCTLYFGFKFALGLLVLTVAGLQGLIWYSQINGKKELFGHPLPLYMLFLTEMWERFSYYGMRGIFMLYMTKYLVLNSGLKAGIYGDYTGLVYITPLLGGFLADRYLGLQKSILVGGLLMAIGQFCLASHAWNDLSVRPTWATIEEAPEGAPQAEVDRIEKEKALVEKQKEERLKEEQAIGSKVGQSLAMLFLGALLLIIGNGMFKPNISTIVGQLYEPSDPRRDAGFTIFYMGINVGAFFAPIICGYLAQEVKWQYGFLAAGIGMVLGTVSFLFGRRMLAGIGVDPAAQGPAESPDVPMNDLRPLNPMEGTVRTGLWAAIVLVLAGGLYLTFKSPEPEKKSGEQTEVAKEPVADAGADAAKSNDSGEAKKKEPPHLLQQIDPMLWAIAAAFSIWIYIYLQPRCTSTELGRVNALYVLAVFVMLFWAAFEQAGSSLTLFAEEYTNNFAFGKKFPSSWWQSLNAIYIIALAPLFSAVWLVLNGVGREPSTPWKMTLGIAFNALSFAIVIPAAAIALRDPTSITRVGPIWLLSLYFLQTCGELCLSPVGLTLVTRLAPIRYAAMMMGMWFFVANAFGNKIAGSAAEYMDKLGPYKLFVTVTLILTGATVILPFFIPWLRKQMAGVK